MLRRRYHAGGGTLPTFGSHRIRHATATLLVNILDRLLHGAHRLELRGASLRRAETPAADRPLEAVETTTAGR